MDTPNVSAQERFNEAYITSSEICQELEVTRPAIHFRRKAGLLPDAIIVTGQQLVLWERDKVKPFIDQWRTQLLAKRGPSE
jgi:hypothetical protein